jgi:glucose-6-phosphate 1-dehydrogenase
VQRNGRMVDSLMNPSPSDALVFFGATGDLAYKKIFPALHAMIRRGHLDLPIIGVAKGGGDLGHLKQRAKESLESHGGVDANAFGKLCERLRYVDGDYGDPQTFAMVRQALGSAQHPLHYLAIPPILFETVAGGLAGSGCAAGARVVVEKPFGRDLASAKALNRTLHDYFAEDAIFRIDHFLGKEPVENLVFFRAANPLIEATWNHRHIASIQITMAESFGVEGRGKFYDSVGAIRDVVQNHMLQIVACLGMDIPDAKGHDRARDGRARLLAAIRPLDPASIVRGQFRGYRSEPGVDPASTVETFAAMRFAVESPRWTGVPFYVRVGKLLPSTATEVTVTFKQLHHPVLDEAAPPASNYLRFRLGPGVVIALGANVKKPGQSMIGERTELVMRSEPADAMGPYEHLLGDALAGDATLFAREDAIEHAWRIVDPVVGNVAPNSEYDGGTWGPPEAARLLAPGDEWIDPKAE